jgi:hypothetical protein
VGTPVRTSRFAEHGNGTVYTPNATAATAAGDETELDYAAVLR